MNTKVKVVANKETGMVITPSKTNPDFGFIRLVQNIVTVDENGFIKPSTRSAFLKGPIDQLKMLGYVNGTELPGNIIVKESNTPTNPKNLDQDVKIAGESGVPCVANGAYIYRKEFYTTNPEESDVFMAHDNGDEIRAAMRNRKAEINDAKIDETDTGSDTSSAEIENVEVNETAPGATV